MKKSRVQIFDICAVLAFSGMIFLYWGTVSAKLDSVFLHLFGKSLTNRGTLFQSLTALVLMLLCAGLLILIHRFAAGKTADPRIRYAGILLLLTVPAAQFFIICVNQILRRDDYWEIADAHSYGFPGSIFFELKNHEGRYFSWFLKSLYAYFEPVPYVRIRLVTYIIILAYACTLTAECFLKFQGRPGNDPGQRMLKFMTGFCYAVMIILLASNTWEVWFWSSGTTIYGLSVSLCILGFALVWRNHLAEGKVSRIRRCAAVLVCFLACGGSELSTASLTAFLFLLMVWKRITEKKWDKWLVIHFAEAAACAGGNLLLTRSVATARRYVEHGSSPEQSFLSRLPEMIRSTVVFLFRYTFIDHRPLLLFLLIFLMLGTQLRFDPGIRKKIAAAAVLLILTAHAVLFINVLLDYMPARVVAIPMCWVYAAMALLCLCTGSRVSERLAGRADPALITLCAILLVFCVNDFYTENIALVRQIRESWTKRDAELADRFDDSKPIFTCSLPTLGSSTDDISDDPEDLYNIAVRMYYRVPAVIADRRCPPFDGE